MSDVTEAHLNGEHLYGEEFTTEQLRRWYEQEETGYFDLLTNHYGVADSDGEYEYEYDALNYRHAIKRLSRQRFSCCVALGCAAGGDVSPLAPFVDRFVAIEPAEKWWRQEIGGKPALYLKPSFLGDIDLKTGSADLATSFGVLHHIPNVSHVVGEIARVLRPCGLFAVREPISWMGDWRGPRPGLTQNERGMPMAWFERVACERGFEIVQRRLCMMNPLATIVKKLGVTRPFAIPSVVAVDWLLSEMLGWNSHYRRDRLLQKIAPSSAFWIFRRL